MLEEMKKVLCDSGYFPKQNGGPKTYAICAMGGSGKSEICLKFAFDNRERYAVLRSKHILSLLKSI